MQSNKKNIVSTNQATLKKSYNECMAVVLTTQLSGLMSDYLSGGGPPLIDLF